MLLVLWQWILVLELLWRRVVLEFHSHCQRQGRFTSSKHEILRRCRSRLWSTELLRHSKHRVPVCWAFQHVLHILPIGGLRCEQPTTHKTHCRKAWQIAAVV